MLTVQQLETHAMQLMSDGGCWCHQKGSDLQSGDSVVRLLRRLHASHWTTVVWLLLSQRGRL